MIDAPLTLRCGLTLANRVALAPLTNVQSHADGTLSDVEQAWLVRRARGGFGLVSTCAAYVSEEGKAWSGQLGISNDAHLPGLRRLAAALTSEGTTSIVQLHHAGAKADLAPVKLSTVKDGDVRAATEADLQRVVLDFVYAALRAQKAGFDGVEIHGANGYLFTQFLAPLDNPRTDGWGGDLQGRARLLRAVCQGVRQAVKPGFAVGVRLSPVDTWARRGLVLDDTRRLMAWMADDGMDFVHLSLRDASGAAPMEDGDTPVATVLRAALPASVALFAAGGISDREGAARAVQAGVDVVVIGRAGIAHPDWIHDSKAEQFALLSTPWPVQHLRDVHVGDAFIRYLQKFAGLVEGGAPPRS